MLRPKYGGRPCRTDRPARAGSVGAQARSQPEAISGRAANLIWPNVTPSAHRRARSMACESTFAWMVKADHAIVGEMVETVTVWLLMVGWGDGKDPHGGYTSGPVPRTRPKVGYSHPWDTSWW
jgi:hypothetical protein